MDLPFVRCKLFAKVSRVLDPQQLIHHLKALGLFMFIKHHRVSVLVEHHSFNCLAGHPRITLLGQEQVQLALRKPNSGSARIAFFKSPTE